jgi:hypothetical protein
MSSLASQPNFSRARGYSLRKTTGEIDTSPRLYGGKYKGYTYLEVATFDKNYCDWVLAVENPKGTIKTLQKWLVDRYQAHNPALPR